MADDDGGGATVVADDLIVWAVARTTTTVAGAVGATRTRFGPGICAWKAPCITIAPFVSTCVFLCKDKGLRRQARGLELTGAAVCDEILQVTFDSLEPVDVLPCGHVMHASCYKIYVGHQYDRPQGCCCCCRCISCDG